MFEVIFKTPLKQFFQSIIPSFRHINYCNVGWGLSSRLRGVHTVVHEAILPHTFVRVRPSYPRTRTKVRVCVRVRRPPSMLDFCKSYTCWTYKCTS